MTLVEARDLAIAALKVETSSYRPKVKVDSYDGTFSIKEVRKLYTSTPAILVSALASEKAGVKLAVYLLAKSTDKDLLLIADSVIHGLRHLPGDGRPVLDVSGRSLYDKDAGEIGARLWGFAAQWPHLSKGNISESTGGPVAEELQNIKAKILSVQAGLQIGITDAERTVLKAEADPPFVLVEAKPGQFDSSQAGPVKFKDDQNNLFSVKITGAFELPIKVECWGRDEAESEEIALSFLPLLPYTGTESGKNKTIKVEQASPSRDDSGAAVFSIGLNYTAQIGSYPVIVPTFKTATTTPE